MTFDPHSDASDDTPLPPDPTPIAQDAPLPASARLPVSLLAIGALGIIALLLVLGIREWRGRSETITDQSVEREATLDALRAAPPERDLVALAARFGRIAPDEIDAARTLEEPRPPEVVGDTMRFFVHDIVNQRYLEIDAELELMTDVAAVWVQRGQTFDADALEAGVLRFSEHIYPGLRAAFGSEWSPGVDHDPRIHILHHEPVPGIAGFFSSSDEVSSLVDPYSNAREMFYINLSVFRPGTDEYLALLAHEFQHMIHWNYDRAEPTWVNEGLSEVAPHLVGYGAQHGEAYLGQPDIQLTGWQPTAQTNSAQYAASYLFIAYLQDRYGDPVLRAIVEAPQNGASGIEAAVASVALGKNALAEATNPADFEGGVATATQTVDDMEAMSGDSTPSFDDLFLDWVVANAFGSTRRDDSTGNSRRWTYQRDLPRSVRPEPLNQRGTRDSVNQYGADYWDVTGLVRDGRLKLDFKGAAAVGLLDPLALETALGAAGGYPGLDEDAGSAGSADSANSAGDSPSSGSGGGYPPPERQRPAGASTADPYPDPNNDPDTDDAKEQGAGFDSALIDPGLSYESESVEPDAPAVWWSNQADGMHSRLERQVDLSGAAEAWLDLRLWYELEENWDYAYYTASVDGGATWRTLDSRRTTEADPNGNNLGEGLTGDSNGWVMDRVDLSPFAGSDVILSLDVITDDAVSLAGVAAEDLRIVIDGVDQETGSKSATAGWTPVGWLEIDPRLPQVWGLQLIVDQGQGEPIRVERVEVSHNGFATIEATEVPPDATLTVVISGLTPATRNVASYQVKVIDSVRSSSESSP